MQISEFTVEQITQWFVILKHVNLNSIFSSSIKEPSEAKLDKTPAPAVPVGQELSVCQITSEIPCDSRFDELVDNATETKTKMEEPTKKGETTRTTEPIKEVKKTKESNKEPKKAPNKPNRHLVTDVIVTENVTENDQKPTPKKGKSK